MIGQIAVDGLLARGGGVPFLVLGLFDERDLLGASREIADAVIDTSDLSARELRDRLVQEVLGGDASTSVHLTSFGYKHGLPIDADIVMDVRFLPNPHWDEALRPLTGHDPAVRDFVLERAPASEFLDRFEQLLVGLLPAYEAEGKSYLTVAVGCTGGRHRSVAVVEELARRLREQGWVVRVGHRDLGR